MKIETILTPAELPARDQRDLRATSTFVTALHHGAEAIIPVSEIAKALRPAIAFPLHPHENEIAFA